MNPRLVAIAGVGAFVLALVLWLGPEDTPVSPPEPRAPRSVPSVPPSPGSPSAWPERDPFRYAEAREPRLSAPSRPAVAPTPSPAPTPAASANPIRLVGLVRKGGALKAALSMWGETVILGSGEEARGYKVLSIDDEAGVRLRGPDGAELTLPPSS